MREWDLGTSPYAKMKNLKVRRLRSDSTRGFSLVELITAMALFAILALFASKTATGARNSAYMAVLRSDLAALARAQEVHHVANETYEKNEKKLEFQSSPDVTIKIRADEDGWSARGEHRNRPNDQFFCTIYVGDIDAYTPVGDEGVVACQPETGKKKGKKEKKK